MSDNSCFPVPGMSAECLDRCRGERVLLMCGVSGSGKTLLSRKFEEMGFHRVSVDDIAWSAYGPELNDMPFDAKKNVFIQAAAEAERQIETLLAKGERIVVDSTMCKRAKRDHMHEICSRHGVTPLVIYLNPPAGLLSQRLENRKGTGPDDQIVTPEQLESFLANFEKPDTDENFITVV